MAKDLIFSGIRDHGTFKLNATTASAIQADPMQIVNKVVTITGNYEVGYGSDADEPFGVVSAVEKVSANSTEMVVTVNWGQVFEDIPCAGTEHAGEFLACNGNGGLKTSVEATNCIALGVETGGTNTCTIRI